MMLLVNQNYEEAVLTSGTERLAATSKTFGRPSWHIGAHRVSFGTIDNGAPEEKKS